MESISKPIKRYDFDEKIEGKAKYCGDIHLENMIYAKTVRSEIARGKIISIEISVLPSGYFIIDYKDVTGKNVVPIVYEDQPFFAENVVNYIGEPILLVAGPDKQIILEIIKNIKIKYQPQKPILSIEEAVNTNENYIFGNKPSFVEYEYSKGNINEAIKNAEFFVEDEFRTGYQEQAYLEPQSMAAVYDGNRVTVYGSMQCPYYIKEALKQALGWREDRIRVVQLPTGGGFGGKEEYPSIPAVHAALAAIKTGKPVQLIFDRQEDIIASTKRHPSIIKIKSYIDEVGNIIAREVDIKIDAGAYAGLSSVVLQRMSFSVCGVYNVENLKVTSKAYATNNIVAGAFRGFGGPQAFFSIEMHMENIAKRLNIDSLELKKKYFLEKGNTSSTGGVFNYDIKLQEIAEVIERNSDYKKKRRAFSKNKDKLKGIGCSIFFHGCGFTGSGENELLKSKVRLKKYRDNTVEIFVSSTEMGQGSLTTLSKIVARTLDIPIQYVKHRYPDTDSCPDSGPTVASRTVMIIGRLLQICAIEMKKRWNEEEFEIIKKYEYPKNLSWNNDKLQGNAYPEYAWGANVVEVEIDPLAYEIKVKGIWSVYDVGNPIDERIVKGQIEGGIIQGLGYGSMEVLQVDAGRILQINFTNYTIPTSVDFPKIESQLIDNPFEEGPFGARGLGELTLVGAAPALALAVQNAIGYKIEKIPVTPEYIMELMNYGYEDKL